MIKTFKLTKKFGDLIAVDELDLEIKEGEIFALLGPNGAGKTTTISMLCGLLAPTSGSATVNNFDVLSQPLQVRKSIGIVFQSPSIDDLLTARENLELHGLLYGMEKSERHKRIPEVLKIVGLLDRADGQIKTYSGGMRKRAEIARGLMHMPKVLFLDEPTTGLDPQTRTHIWNYIRDLSKKNGITVLLTTHYMEEAENLADRIAIIDHGKLVALGSPFELKEKMGGNDLVIAKTSKDIVKLTKGMGFVKKVERDGELVKITLENAGKNLCKLLAKTGELGEIEVRKPTLNDVFIHYTGRDIREDKAEGGIFERSMNSNDR
ncbi:MAG: ATP-binding cassette domain-containing protein [Candidatus Micrarchaeota archaeon]